MKEISCDLCQQLVPRSTMTKHRNFFGNNFLERIFIRTQFLKFERYENPVCLRAQIEKLKASQDLKIFKEKHKEELEKEKKSHQFQLNKLIKTVNIEFPETTIFHLFIPCNEKHVSSH